MAIVRVWKPSRMSQTTDSVASVRKVAGWGSPCGVGNDEQRLSCNFVCVGVSDSSSINPLCCTSAQPNNMRNTRSRKSHHSGKENGTASLHSTPSASSSKGKEKVVPKGSARNVRAKREKEELLFCSCRGLDDGTPMVQCGNCNEWSGFIVVFSSSSTDDHHRRYHFRCVNLNEDDASEMSESSVFHFHLLPL